MFPFFPGVNTPTVANCNTIVMPLKVDLGRRVCNGPHVSQEPVVCAVQPDCCSLDDFSSFHPFFPFFLPSFSSSLFFFPVDFFTSTFTFFSLLCPWFELLFCTLTSVFPSGSFRFVICDVLSPALGLLASPTWLLFWHLTFQISWRETPS